jgi:hypothetical protein
VWCEPWSWICAIDHFCRDDGILIFGVPVFFGRGLHSRIDALHGVVAAHFAAGLDQHGDERLQAFRSTGAIDQQGLGSAADAGAAHLGIEHDRLRHL